MEFGGYLNWKYYIETNIKNNFWTNAKIQRLYANVKISLYVKPFNNISLTLYKID